MTESSQALYHVQCPHCAAVQKISYPQLQASQGLVVCRRCEAHYPAKGHLLTPQQLQALIEKVAQIKAAQALQDAAVASNAVDSEPTPPTPADSHDVNDDLLDSIFEQLAQEAHAAESVNLQSERPVSSTPGSPEPESADSAYSFKLGKKSGLFAKLLSKQHASAAQSPSVFETTVAQHKAKLHPDDAPNETADTTVTSTWAASAVDAPAAQASDANMETQQNNQAAKAQAIQSTTDFIEVEMASSNGEIFEADIFAEETETPTPTQAPASFASKFAAATPNFGKSALVFELQGAGNTEFDHHPMQDLQDADAPTIGIHERLKQEQRPEPIWEVLSEDDVSAPEYDASKQWFTQLFANLQQAAQQPPHQTEIGDDDDGLTINRLHEPSRTNTVAMKLPENSMLVFTLEDDGKVHNQLQFIDIQERLPAKPVESLPPPPQIVQINQQQHNEHTVWTVANIVAILVLIIQMFYYFLMLNP